MIYLLFKFITYNFIKMGFHLDFLVGKQEKLNLFVRNLYLNHRKVKKQKSLSHIWIFVTPMDYTVHGILQDRILEWVAFPFSRGSSLPRDWTQVSLIAGRLFTSWATRKAQEYWSGWPIPSLADVLNPGIKPGSPALQVDSLPTELSGKPWVFYYISTSLI